MTERKYPTVAETMAAQKVKDDIERKRFAAERKAMAERTAKALEASEHARKVKAADDQIATHERALKEAIKSAYVTASGGNESGFEAAYPRLRQAWIEAQTLANAEVKPQTTADVVRRMLDLRYGAK